MFKFLQDIQILFHMLDTYRKDADEKLKKQEERIEELENAIYQITTREQVAFKTTEYVSYCGLYSHEVPVAELKNVYKLRKTKKK